MILTNVIYHFRIRFKIAESVPGLFVLPDKSALSISIASSLSYIYGFLVYPFLQESIHRVPVSYDIHRPAELLLQILLDTDKAKQVRLAKFDNNINVALLIHVVSGRRAEHTDTYNFVSIPVQSEKVSQSMNYFILLHTLLM